jgi:hypothetical protein
MPVGKELGAYAGTFTSVRIVENDGDRRIFEGSYSANVSGQLNATLLGTMTFSGTDKRGTLSDRGVGYFDTGEILAGKGQGVYWLNGNGNWEMRAAFILPEQAPVGEGQVTLTKGVLTLSGKIFELT